MKNLVKRLLAIFLLTAISVSFLPACNDDKKQCELYAFQFPYITRIGDRTDQDCVNMNILLFFVLNWDVLYGNNDSSSDGSSSSSNLKQAELEKLKQEVLKKKKEAEKTEEEKEE